MQIQSWSALDSYDLYCFVSLCCLATYNQTLNINKIGRLMLDIFVNQLFLLNKIRQSFIHSFQT